jgi:hypothetical protein
MSTFHISHILPQRPHLTPILCHFENVLANDDQGFAVSTSPEAGRGSGAFVLLKLEELSSWRSIWLWFGRCQKQ